MANPNDTQGARVTGGFIGYPRHTPLMFNPTTHPGPYLGSPRRGRQATGELSYRPISSGQMEYGRNRQLKKDGGKAVETAQKYGLPKHIRGNPLGCGCNEAHLAGATKPVGSHIEADYMCDVGWHNYVVFELIGFEAKTESSIKVDANGNLIEDAKTEPRELGDF